MASSDERVAPSRASTDMPCVTAIASLATAAACVPGGNAPFSMSRSIRAVSRPAMSRRTSPTTSRTSAEATDPLAVALASRLATKFAFNGSASPLAATQAGGRNPIAGGAGAKNILRALDASLKRLGTDYVDLYWMHIWDGVTPVEEIMQTLDDLVQAGKIRYYAFSDMPAEVAMKAATIASERRVPGPIAMQVEYSLVARDVESEQIPAAREAGMGVMPWSPLAGGFLTGKYRREDTSGSGRLSGPTRSAIASSPPAIGWFSTR